LNISGASALTRLTLVFACLLGAASIQGGAPAPGRAAASAAAVSVYPIPGSRVASPKAQIAFRGIPAGQLGAILVTGSRSGTHTGTVRADSDGNGGSFLPDRPFTPGEVVTVSTALNVLGAATGAFQFTVATPAGGIPPIHWPAASRVSGDVSRFHSRPDLAPAVVKIIKRGRAAQGDIFLAPQFGPLQDGPMIVDSGGSPVWFHPLSRDDSASDFRVQTYLGNPVLTWWQGYVTAGVGVGAGYIYNSSYQQIAVVHGVNGLNADLHEFQITPSNTALITAYWPVYWEAPSAHGSKRETVLDSVVQEIDIPTGLLLFQWDSLDHVPVGDSYAAFPARATYAFDYFHVNTVEPDDDGTLLISGRNTSAAYKVNPQTGAVIWTLGGRHSSFKLGPGASFAFQHDVRVRANNDLFVTLLDNGGGPPFFRSQSRGVKLILDLKHMTARIVAEHVHSPSLLALNEGDFQQLPDGDDFLGWGAQPYFTEYDPRGRVIFDGQFVGANSNYHAYRFPWKGTPQTLPDVAASAAGKYTAVYASWNGATGVSAWRVLSGPSATALRPTRTVADTGFETATRINASRWVAVEALDSSGHTLATSPTVRAA
jgi:Arylsulfotransferase (ASST)